MTPEQLDERVERLMRVAEAAVGMKGYGVSPSFLIETHQLLRDYTAAIVPEKQPPMKSGEVTKDSIDLDKIVFSYKKGHNQVIDTIQQNADNLLGSNQ